ncbi:MAG: TRAFs-binding domain-containing protein [Candidatus Fermentibacteria bacterium]|nr:TRAFs-binding domain-containing protein [Candidatus Fermentibacteria bacterium]
MVFKGLIIKSEAVERLLDRVYTFSSSGQWQKAESILDKLIVAKPWDKRLLLAKAHLRKRMWISSDCENQVLLAEALHLFSRCHLLTGSVEAGINTATLLLLSGNEEDAYKRADDTSRHCRQLIIENDIGEQDNYAVTIAEGNLVRGRLEAAESWYKTAMSKNDLVSEHVIDNINLLLNHLMPDQAMAVRIREAVGA